MGAISTLLVTGPVIHSLHQAVTSCGGILLEFPPSSEVEHKRLTDLGGVCALLRFVIPDEDDDNEFDCAESDTVTAENTEKPSAIAPAPTPFAIAASKHLSMLDVAAAASEAFTLNQRNITSVDLSEDAMDELESMTAIYPENFAQVSGSGDCFLSAFSDDDTKGAIIRVSLGVDYPQTALVGLQVEAAIGLDEVSFLRAGQALCVDNGREGEPALFELMMLLGDAVNMPTTP